jgi:O-antigen ligase
MTRLIRIVNPNELKPVHVVMLALLALALAGNCLLTSAGKPRALPDGANAWPSDSLLLAIVEILDLQYAQPTPNGIAIKSLVAGTAAGLGIIVAAIGILFRARSQGSEADDDAVIELDESRADESAHPHADDRPKKHIDPVLASQFLMLLYVAWAFAATLWSNAPSFAWGGAIILGTNVLWAFALALCLNRRAAVISGYCLVGVLVLTGALACWYVSERNSIQRASYPIGNPLLLAACLIPGVLLAVSFVVRGLDAARSKQVARGVTTILISVLACAVMFGAFYLTRSRGPTIALGLGLFAVAAFAGGRDVKLIAAVIGVIGIAVVAIYFFNQRDASSVTGRDASMRFRLYSWNYAMDLFSERPLRGHGLGGYALLADGLAAQDVLIDPAALGSRVSHAHGEWLEVASDLGGVGLVLLLGALFLAVYGGTNAIPDINDPTPRWMLIGLSAALAALIAEECFNVGLQIVGLPFVFYTVLGLVWALARPVPDRVISQIARRWWLGWMSVIAAFVFGLGALEYARRNFVAARALHDMGDALAESDWNKAALLSKTAYDDRLRPQRKLTALIQKVASQLYIAEQLQVQYVRRMRIQAGATQPDLNLEQHMKDDRQKCETILEQSLADLQFVRSIVSSEMGIGMLEFKLRTLRAVFAEIEGRTEDVAQEGVLAAKALGAQLERQPFDPELATRFVIASIRQLEVPAALEILARPLRMGIVTDRYMQAIGALVANSDFGTEAINQIEGELNGAEATELTDRVNRWAPEILRVGAVTAYVQGRPDKPIEYLRAAAKIYDDASAEPNRIPLIAHAGCYAELADALFRADPADPQPAIAAANSALQRVPASTDGRVLIAALRERVMAYHLAADHESFVRDRLTEQMPGIDTKQLDGEVANRYMKMAYSVLGNAYERIPYKLNGWSQRALALNSESAANWFLAADVSILVGDEAQTVERINRAIENGGETQDVYAIVLRAANAMPTSSLIAGMRTHIERELGISRERVPTPEPTPPVPSGENEADAEITEEPEAEVPETKVPETKVPGITEEPETEEP